MAGPPCPWGLTRGLRACGAGGVEVRAEVPVEVSLSCFSRPGRQVAVGLVVGVGAGVGGSGGGHRIGLVVSSRPGRRGGRPRAPGRGARTRPTVPGLDR